MKFLPLVVRNLFRKRRRTLLAVAAVAVSIFMFAALMSLPGVVDQILREPAGSLRLVCYSKAGFFYSSPSNRGGAKAVVGDDEEALGRV